MGLVTLLLLIAFTVYQLRDMWEKKPAFVQDCLSKMDQHIRDLSFFVCIYGLVMIVVTLVSQTGMDFLIRFLANLMLVVMTLSELTDRLLAKFQDKMNAAIVTETHNIVAQLVTHQKYISYAAGVVSVLLFAVLFK